MTPAERHERAKRAANMRWMRPLERKEASERQKAAILDRFLTQVDPDGNLPDDKRAVLARSAMAAHMALMRLRRAQGDGGQRTEGHP